MIINEKSPNQTIQWKLKFHTDRIGPNQPWYWEIQSAYIFKGRLLTFTRPESFVVRKLMVGRESQFVPQLLPDGSHNEIPCVVLHSQEIALSTAVIGVPYSLEVRNVADYALPFYAELHGTIVLPKGEVPRPNDWEDYSTL